MKRWLIILGLILICTGNALAANDNRQPPINHHLSSSIFHPLSSTFLPSSVLSPSTVYTLMGTGHLPSTDGAKLYEFWCSTCHGDRGQGLTAEWRAQWPEGKQNCWQAKCHAASHPPDGFTIPKNVPALIGPATLTKFTTAQDLYAYTRAAMPYWSPNMLSDDEYQAITIFLVKANYAAKDLPVPAGLAQDLSTVSLSSSPQVGGTSRQQVEISTKAEQAPVDTMNPVILSTAGPQSPAPNPQIYLAFLWIPLIALGGLFAIFLALRISSRSQ